MCTRYLRIASLFLLLCHVGIWGSEREEYFWPRVYYTLWPDFCFHHLEQFPDSCSEQSIDKEGNFYVDFLRRGNANAYIDRELISLLRHDVSLIPTINRTCNFRFCELCHTPVVGGVFEEDDDENEEPIYNVFRRCRCLDYWYDEDDFSPNKHDSEIVEEEWNRCSEYAIPHGYFDFRSKQFTPFLQQQLQYQRENLDCLCYWPYRSKRACSINDFAYDALSALVEDSYFHQLTKSIHNSKCFPSINNASPHGVLTSLLNHAFFYSQYRQILLQLASWGEEYSSDPAETIKALDSLYALLGQLQAQFLPLYDTCLNQHPHPKIYYERGMIRFHQGETFDSLSDMRQLIIWAEQHHQEELLTSELYYQEGAVYAELGRYDLAIEALSKAIHKDPTHKQAYFERAAAYFELGDIDRSLEDYLASDIRSQTIRPNAPNAKETLAFSQGLIQGILAGGTGATVEFIPSLLSSLQGLSQGLWALASDPIGVSTEMVQATQNCIEFVKTNTPKELFTKLAPELQEAITNWDHLKHEERGLLAGQIIGKYGVEIFAARGLTKGVQVYRELKAANQILTYEALLASQANRKAIALEAAQRAQRRAEVLKANVKICQDAQGKHIPGHKNFEPARHRSILEHTDPERLVHDFCGTGMRITGEPGVPGYTEIVNFKEFIGYEVTRETGEKTATTWGKIHYSKKGTHIVPTKPRE